MKRYISTKERPYYTDMLEIFLSIKGSELKYKWLVSDIEAYPPKNSSYKQAIENNTYLILSGQDMLNMLSQCAIQWIWAVFSAIPEHFSDEEILKYPLPCADENAEIYQDNIAIIQHPLADIEIVAEDSTSVFIVSKDEQIAEGFKRLFPKCKTNY